MKLYPTKEDVWREFKERQEFMKGVMIITVCLAVLMVLTPFIIRIID